MLAHAQDYVRTLPEKYPDHRRQPGRDHHRQHPPAHPDRGEQLVSASSAPSSTWWPSSSAIPGCR